MHFLKPLKMLKNPTKQYKKCNQPNFYRFNWLHLGGQGWIRRQQSCRNSGTRELVLGSGASAPNGGSRKAMLCGALKMRIIHSCLT